MTIDIRAFAHDPAAFQAALIIPSARGTAKFGDVMGDFQKERFAGINPALLSISQGNKPEFGRHWWEATKGASKDSDLAVCLLWLLAFSKRPLTCQVGAADMDQADELRKAAKDILRLNEWLATRIQLQAMKIVCKANGSECEIIAADVAGSHGARPDVLILNELSHVTKQEFAENLMDNAAKVPHGLAVIATNSGFEGTWQERWRAIAIDSPRWKTHIYSRPAPWLDDDEMAEAKRRNSHARFMRLWWGVWASGAGDALDAEDLQAAIFPLLKPTTTRDPEWFYVGGLDLGIKHDHSALVVLAGNQKTQRIRLAHAQSWAPDPETGKVNLMAVERAVLEAHQRFNMKTCGYDPYQAALMAQRLELQRVRLKEVPFTGTALNLMASTLLDVFRSRRIELFDCPQLISDLRRLTIEEKSYGYRLSATRDDAGHADLATSLALSLPIAVEFLGETVPLVWAYSGGPLPDQLFGSPFLRELQRLNRESARRQPDQAGHGSTDHNEPVRDFLNALRSGLFD